MALDVRLTYAGATPVTHRLQTENVVISVRRAAMSSPVPGNADPILIDLGQRQDEIAISGIAPLTNETEDGATILSAFNLRNWITDNYSSSMALRIDAQFDGTTIYASVKVNSLVLERSALQVPEKWKFRLTFLGREAV